MTENKSKLEKSNLKFCFSLHNIELFFSSINLTKQTVSFLVKFILQFVHFMKDKVAINRSITLEQFLTFFCEFQLIVQHALAVLFLQLFSVPFHFLWEEKNTKLKLLYSFHVELDYISQGTYLLLQFCYAVRQFTVCNWKNNSWLVTQLIYVGWSWVKFSEFAVALLWFVVSSRWGSFCGEIFKG